MAAIVASGMTSRNVVGFVGCLPVLLVLANEKIFVWRSFVRASEMSEVQKIEPNTNDNYSGIPLPPTHKPPPKRREGDDDDDDKEIQAARGSQSPHTS